MLYKKTTKSFGEKFSLSNIFKNGRRIYRRSCISSNRRLGHLLQHPLCKRFFIWGVVLSKGHLIKANLLQEKCLLEGLLISLSISKLLLKAETIINNSQPCAMNLTCDIIFQICCRYQNSEPHKKTDEISNPRNLLGTICQPIYKACGSFF